jgi:hypothetical protein
MKKMCFLITVLSALAMTVCVHAAEVDLDYMTGTAVISGSTNSASEYVAVNVLKPDVTLDMLYKGTEDGIIYNNDTVTDAKGAYSFKLIFDDNAPEGEYTVYVGAKSQESAEIMKLPYLKKSTYESNVKRLNSAAKTGAAEFKREFNSLKNSMGFTNELENMLNSDKVAEIFYQSVKEKALSESDGAVNKKLYNSAVTAQALNEKKLSDMTGLIDNIALGNKKTAEFYNTIISKSKSGTELYISLLEGNNIISAKDLETSMLNATVLTVVRYHNGIGNIEKVFKEYSREIGANTSSAKNADYSYIAGKSYNSVGECITDFNTHIAQSSSNGGGGGGGSSSGNTEKPSQIIQPPSSLGNNQNVTPMKIKFEDLNSVQWAYEAISKLFAKGIVTGRTDTIFAPDDNVTREEFAKLIVTAFDLTAENYENKYSDVQSGAWYDEYVRIATANGICQGIGDGVFGVGSNITRQDMCVMLANAMKVKGYNLSGSELEFADKELVADYAYESVSSLSDLKIVNGVGDNMFDPQGIATRAQAAVIINNAMEQ